MFKRFTAITVAIAGAFALLGSPAQGATTPDDCNRVASADRAVCRTVKAQHAYGWTDSKGNPKNWVAKGSALVKEITHQGLTKREMGDYLRGEASNYRTWVTHVTVNMDDVMRKCGSDGMGAVQFVDEDGKPGGAKYTWKRIVCA